LAAILFPVFAQAKAAAKGAASLSNTKQIGLAVIMYSNDYDDTYPHEVIWGGNDAYWWYGFPGSEFSPWTWECMPYTKNADIFEDPLTTPNAAQAGVPLYVTYAYAAEFAYNFTALSPWKAGPGPNGESTYLSNMTQTQLAKPADTVMATSSSNGAEEAGNYWWGVGGPQTEWSLSSPVCSYNTNSDYCAISWGHNDWWADLWLKDNVAAGAFTGNVSIRRANQAVTLLCDGHAKALAIGQLAAGTNWNPNIDNSQMMVTNPSAYIWGTN